MKKKSLFLVLLFTLIIFPVMAAGEHSGNSGEDVTHRMMVLAFQVALILIVAKLFGILFSRVFKQPSSLGEIVAGIIIGPYALGGISLPFIHVPIFTLVESQTIPVSIELYGLAVIASIVLLFLSGLETDLPTFIRFAGKGSLVGLGGAVFSFILADLCAVWFLPEVTRFMDPTALFLGTLSTATSVGITARILTEKKQMGSPEGVTILAGAVLDDVIGIILLAVVVGLSGAEQRSLTDILVLSAKAFGFWIISTILGILLIPRLTKGLKKLKSIRSVAFISLGLALFLSGLAESFGLALIIGAYIMGLSFSQTDIAHQIRESIEGIYDFLVPIFFCVMGMMVDFRAMKGVVVFGLIFSIFTIIAKVFGSGLPAMLSGFNLRGSMRVGFGMLPRGEVTLIIAGIGLSTGAISQSLFGVAIMMLLITTLIAPPLLVQSLKGGSGYMKKFRKPEGEGLNSIEMDLGNAGLATLFRRNLLNSFRLEEFFVQKLESERPLYSIRKDNLSINILQTDSILKITAPPYQESFVRLMIVEEVLSLKELLSGLDSLNQPELMGAEVMKQMFNSASE